MGGPWDWLPNTPQAACGDSKTDGLHFAGGQMWHLPKSKQRLAEGEESQGSSKESTRLSLGSKPGSAFSFLRRFLLRDWGASDSCAS